MTLTKQLQEEVLNVYNSYWENYLAGEVEYMSGLLAAEYTQIRSSASEIFFSKPQAVQFLHDTIDQVAGKAKMCNRSIRLEPLHKMVVVYDIFDVYVRADNDWAFHAQMRATTLMEEKTDGWKFIHQHSSLPDARTEQGENLALDKIAEENQQLKEAVKRRTIELEQKNRELEIEAALERVRSRAMAMQSSSELPQAASLLFEQIQLLGMPAWSAGYCLWDDDKKTITLWMSSEGLLQPPFRAPLTEDPSFIHMREAYERGETFYVEEVGGEHLVKHYEYMRTLPVVGKILDSIVEAGYPLPTFQIFHLAYFSQGFLLFITYEPVTAAHDIFKRFAKLFDQTYTRFLDLQKAEVQAKDAQIETALEKVRSRSLAMHKSEELQAVVNTLFERLNDLDIKMDSANIAIFKEGTRDFEYWVSSPYQQRVQAFHIPYADLVLTKELIAARERGCDFHGKTYSLEEKNEWFNYAFEHTEFKGLSEERKKMILAAKVVTISIAFAAHTGIQVTRYSEEFLSPDQVEILKKFSKVFEQAYIRFLDLQKAEAQTREAQIEASLEKVRAKAMAMRNTQDLADTIGVFYKELHSYSMTPIRCGVGLLNKDSRIADLFTWNTTEKGQSLELVGNLKMEGHPVLENVYHNWINETEYHPVLRGNEIKHYYEILRPQMAFPNYDDNIIQYGYFFFFKEGGVYAWMSKEMSEDELKIYRRFTSVLSLTYKRHKDLQLAEAHALQAEQDLLVIKEARQKAETALIELQATQKQLIQSEKMASLGELTAGIAHEIQNPLNFVNNFSEVNTELIEELQEEIDNGKLAEVEALAKNIKENEEKINFHGKRADAIVKSMLQHSRSSSGQKELTDINQLADEYLRLSYHGLRAKNSSLNAVIKTEFDGAVGKINIIPQDIGRVLLNLFTNAFYAANEKAKRNIDQFQPTVSVSTKQLDDKIIISVNDNGDGIPKKVLDKIFQPFFTTKPTGQGTGLGLSLGYDIVKAHGGEILVETKEGEGAEFIIQLPV